jgi:hypothetical protein
MYSLVLQVTDTKALEARIAGLARQVISGGRVALEFIDCGVSEIVYPEGVSTSLYQGPHGWMNVASRYDSEHATIAYDGQLDGRNASYTVTFVRATPNQMVLSMQHAGLEAVQVVRLDMTGRRLLAAGRVTAG